MDCLWHVTSWLTSPWGVREKTNLKIQGPPESVGSCIDIFVIYSPCSLSSVSLSNCFLRTFIPFVSSVSCNLELFLQPFYVCLTFLQHLLLSFLFHTWGTRCLFTTSSSIHNLCSVSELWGGRKSRYSKCCFHAKRCVFGMVWYFLFWICLVLSLTSTDSSLFWQSLEIETFSNVYYAHRTTQPAEWLKKL